MKAFDKSDINKYLIGIGLQVCGEYKRAAIGVIFGCEFYESCVVYRETKKLCKFGDFTEIAMDIRNVIIDCIRGKGI